jgi:hypothetical protein
MTCKYCKEKEEYYGLCETHWMLGVYFQYEQCGKMWNYNEGNDGMMRKYEMWIKTLTEDYIQEIRYNYWLIK